MLSRNCPKCEKPLGEYDYFFCSACGEKLPQELINLPSLMKLRHFKLTGDSPKKVLREYFAFLGNKTFMAILGLILIILLAIAGIFSTGVIELITVKFQKGVSDNLIDLSVRPQKKNVVKIESIDYLEGTFGVYDFASFAPRDAVFYAEGFDVSALASYFARNTNLEPVLSRSAILLEDNFGVYYVEESAEEDSSTGGLVYLFVMRDPELIFTLFEDFEDEVWAVRSYSDFLLLSTNSALFDQVDSVQAGLTSSLAKNSDFVVKRNVLEPLGSIQVIFMDKGVRETIRNNMGGLNQETIANINLVINSEFESLIVN